jgi:hypothetical protein
MKKKDYLKKRKGLKKKNFRRGSISWEYLVGAIIVIIVLIVLLVIFFQGTEKGSKDIKDKLVGTKDSDNDGTADLFDQCPCDDSIGDNFPEGKTKADCAQDDCPK